jgi:hypothetical protein
MIAVIFAQCVLPLSLPYICVPMVDFKSTIGTPYFKNR